MSHDGVAEVKANCRVLCGNKALLNHVNTRAWVLVSDVIGWAVCSKQGLGWSPSLIPLSLTINPFSTIFTTLLSTFHPIMAGCAHSLSNQRVNGLTGQWRYGLITGNPFPRSPVWSMPLCMTSLQQIHQFQYSKVPSVYWLDLGTGKPSRYHISPKIK